MTTTDTTVQGGAAPDAAPQTTQTQTAQTTPESAAPQTTPAAAPSAEAPKFLGRFKDEAEANEHLGRVEKEHQQYKAFVEAVAPKLNIDPNTGEVTFRPDAAKQPADGSQPDPNEEYVKDPTGFIVKTANLSAEQLAQTIQSFETQKGSLHRKYEDKDPFFQEHWSETQKALDTMPFKERGKPGVVEAAFNLIRSRDIDRIVEAEAKKRSEAARRDTKVIKDTAVDAGGGTSKSTDEAAVELSQEEKKAADGLGITYADYAKEKAAMRRGE